MFLEKALSLLPIWSPFEFFLYNSAICIGWFVSCYPVAVYFGPFLRQTHVRWDWDYIKYLSKTAGFFLYCSIPVISIISTLFLYLLHSPLALRFCGFLSTGLWGLALLLLIIGFVPKVGI
jgi:hypothetical protein